MSAVNRIICLSAMCTLVSCVSASIHSDMSRVKELTRIDTLPRTEETDIDPSTQDAARQLLEQPLDAETAVRIAILNNRELRATLREMGIARGRLLQAGVLPNPVFEGELLPERNTQLELRLEYDLTKAVLAPMQSNAAAPELEAARYRAAAAVIELGYRVRAAFYRLQSAQQRLTTAHDVLDGFAASRDASRALYQAGNIRELDLASQEAAYERARVMVSQLELELVEERERLQRFLGLHGADTEWKLRGALSPAPDANSIPDQLETRALRASLDLLETRQRLEGLARRAGITRTAGWLPDITVDVHSLQGNPDGTANEPWRFGGGLSLSLPIFDRQQGNAVALEAQFDALLERYYGLATDLRSNVREARARLQSSYARARQYQTIIVPAQQRVTQQTLLQYNAMQLGVFQLLQARREELDVQLAYTDTLREYWTCVAELEALLAGRRVAADGRAGVNAATSTAVDAPTGGH